jgi:23S rRNA (uridine2552-2'-O)-methyltransferase
VKKTRTKSNWIKEHLSDKYVQKAQYDGYRSRAAYKLIEINAKYSLVKKNNRIVDLGSAPGSWSQALSSIIGESGEIFAIDLLPMEEVKNTTFIQGDFQDNAILDQLELLLKNQPVDLVISDMAPNISGNKTRDQALIIGLNELSLEFAKDWLKPKGNFLVKTFMGSGFEEFVKTMKNVFKRVIIKKPESSRDRSAEFFLIGLEKL